MAIWPVNTKPQNKQNKHRLLIYDVKSTIKINGIGHFKGKEQSFFSNNFIVLNHIQIRFITIYDGCLT